MQQTKLKKRTKTRIQKMIRALSDSQKIREIQLPTREYEKCKHNDLVCWEGEESKRYPAVIYYLCDDCLQEVGRVENTHVHRWDIRHYQDFELARCSGCGHVEKLTWR